MSATIKLSDITCPITLGIMVEPVTGSDGTNYDRPAITEWLREHGTSPTTRQPMTESQLIPNRLLKDMIERYNKTKVLTPQVPVKPFIEAAVSLKATLETKPSGSFLNIEVTPPEEGTRQGIVMGLGVDTSGSMNTLACDITETGGLAFTRLDLTKHALRAIATELGPDDIFYIVPFSDSATLALPPTRMDDAGKDLAFDIIKNLTPNGSTNIWHCMQILNTVGKKPEYIHSNVVLGLLTDGEANIRPPCQDESVAYSKIERNGNMNIFGFGNALNSKLLSSIASVGRGSFGYIPDYSMVGTVFINWAASVLATASKDKVVYVTYDDGSSSTHNTSLIQYGQTRNITFKTVKKPIHVSFGEEVVPVSNGTLSGYVWARYSMLEAMTFCVGHQGDINAYQGIYHTYSTSSDFKASELVRDLKPIGDDDEGQLCMAPRFYRTWGEHYTRSYKRAMELEQSMNFKDHAFQVIGGKLFKELRSLGDDVFCNLPPLTPTGQTLYGGVTPTVATTPINMGTVFMNRGGGCWASTAMILMAGNTRIPMKELRAGMMVWTTTGPSRVEYTIALQTKEENGHSICKYKNTWITPWHPVINDTGQWVYPAKEENVTKYAYTDIVYNLVVENGGVIDVDDTWSVGVGHDSKDEGVAHAFFGSRKLILESIKGVTGFKEGNVHFKNVVTIRDPLTGLVCGWKDM